MVFVKRFFSAFLAASILFTGSIQTVQAAMISSAQVAEQAFSAAADQDRARIISALSREDVQVALVARGIDPVQARDRVASLTDEEASTMASQIENSPAGGIIGAIVLIFFVLLLTDILGFTKVYPFTRSVR
ncbi:PA2779 family protein [Methylotenera sp. L2L1]|uniref:PA2779 family protein n=1 Tax=Methylotenera sp. L2L1 TaxID=1502770 RepID=UPI00055E21CB|nr:PA2779 family protein [Methylotenera sp. L2L1]